MSMREFVDISVQVLPANRVKCTIISTLENRPKGLGSVCVGLSTHIFSHTVLDAIMLIWETMITFVIVRVNCYITPC